MGCKLTHALTGAENGVSLARSSSTSPRSNRKKKKKDGGDEYAPTRNGGIDEPPPPPAIDPRLPLTARQKFSIVKSWKGISRALEPTGVVMFQKLFERNAELLNLFSKFRELKTKDEQAESLELAEHASVVMNSIDEGIRSMDNVDFFFDLLYQIGGSHIKIPGFKKEYFWKIEEPFLEAVKLTLEDRYTDNMDQIYRVTIKFIIETVIKGYDMAYEKEIKENGQKHESTANPVENASQSSPVSSAANCPGNTQNLDFCPSSGVTSRGCPAIGIPGEKGVPQGSYLGPSNGAGLTNKPKDPS